MGLDTELFRTVLTYAIFVLFLTLGTRSQTQQMATLHAPIVTGCTKGMREGDRLIIPGSVSGTTGLNLTDWTYLQYFSKSPSATSFASTCFVRLDGCRNISSQRCHCSRINQDSFEVEFNTTAKLHQSCTEVKLVWAPLSSPNSSVNSTTVTLPRIYVKNSAVLTLLLNGKQRTKHSCELQNNVTSVNISYCCTNSPSPCNLRIQYNGKEVIKGLCLNLTVPASSMYTFSHSLCGASYNTVDFVCSVGPLILPSQQVTLQTPIKDTGCTQDAREGEIVMLSGRISGVSGVNLSAWQSVEFLTNADDGINFKTACALSLLSCNNISTSDCYCVTQTKDVYDIYYKLKAQVVFSGAKIKLVWKKTSGISTVLESTPPGTLPTIYGRNSEVLTLVVDGELKSNQSCELKRGTNKYKISYCCTNAPSPCNLKVKYRAGTIIGSSCIDDALAASDKYTFSYSVCDTKYDAGEFHCTVGKMLEVSKDACSKTLCVFLLMSSLVVLSLIVSMGTDLSANNMMVAGTVGIIISISLFVVALSAVCFYKLARKKFMPPPPPPPLLPLATRAASAAKIDNKETTVPPETGDKADMASRSSVSEAGTEL